MTSMKLYRKGMKDGIPISLGYFAVAFTLGIAAKNAGLSSFQASLTSFLVNASAGEFAGFTLIAAGASYLELAIMMAVANARYLLMSCSLSQKFDEKVSIFHRLAVGFYLTDEIFGVSVATPGKLNPVYTYGVITTAAPGWTLGTYLGVVMGNVLPENLVSALSVGLFGMFLAIIIPPARKNKLWAGIIAVSMALSYIATKVSFLKTLSSGTVIIILTVLIAGAAAVLFPAKEEKDEE